eukprot:1223267-Amphidinium_carterae.1
MKLGQSFCHFSGLVGPLTFDKGALRNLLRLTRVGTVQKHLEMVRRFRLYIESFEPTTKNFQHRILTPALVHSWLQALRALNCGAHTLHAAGCGLEKYEGTSSQSGPNLQQKLVMWLERVVLDQNEEKVTRLFGGGYRLPVGAAMRGDDLRKSTPSSLEWIEMSVVKVGLTEFSQSCKPGPRRWVCSVLGASPVAGDGCLQATVDFSWSSSGGSAQGHHSPKGVSCPIWIFGSVCRTSAYAWC